MLSVLVPVYNEEEILESSLARIHAYLREKGLDHEVIVVDNGSTDATPEICKRLQEAYPWLAVRCLPERGVGTAFVEAVRAANGEFLVSLDVDLSVDLAFLEHAADLLKYADMVAGCKTMGSQRRTLLRIVGSQLYIMCTQIFFDLALPDYSIGAKAYRRSSILPALPHLDPWTGYVLEIVLVLKQRRKKILQIGIDCEDLRVSRFNLLHEGLYRYWHLYRSFRNLRWHGSWLHKAQ